MTNIPEPFNTPESRTYVEEMVKRLENGHILPYETFCPECGNIDAERDNTHGIAHISDILGTRPVVLIGCEGYHIHRDWLYATIHRDRA